MYSKMNAYFSHFMFGNAKSSATLNINRDFYR